MDRKIITVSIFVFIFSFILGIVASSFVFIQPLLSVWAVLVGTAIFIIEKILKEKSEKEIIFLSLVFISFGLGALRYSIKDFHPPLIPDLTGVVITEPEQRENFTRFVLRSDNGEKMLINTDLYSPVQYGDKVEVSGKFEEPGVIDDGIGRPFDYAAYLAKDDIYYTLNFAAVEVLSRGEGNFLKHVLFSIKRGFVAKIREILAEPESSLLAGLIVAGKTAMPKNILEEFRRAGVIHIVVLSGYNVTIIAEFMRKMFESLFMWVRFGALPKAAAGASIIGIILFVLMTGAEATVVRASIMVLTVIVAKIFGRNYSASRALLVAGFIMLLENPKILIFDPSFQLSFLATLALIYVVPIVYRYLSVVPEKFNLRMTIATTVATQATVLPLLVYSIGDFSLVSLPANVLILFVIPSTMLIGFVSTLVAHVSSILALPLTYITHLLLAWILGVSRILGNLSFASIVTPSISAWIIILIYMFLIIFVWRFRSSARHSASSN